MPIVWSLALSALVLVWPSFAHAQETAATLPTGADWFSKAWRTWSGIAAVAIPTLVFLSNTIEPLIRTRWPVFASGFRRMMPLSMRIFMSRSMKEVMNNTVIAVTEAQKPGTENVQTTESDHAIVTVALRPATTTTGTAVRGVMTLPEDPKDMPALPTLDAASPPKELP